MEIISHRINSIKQLGSVPLDYGVEFDIRSENGELILAHDPFQSAERLAPFLEAWASQGRKATLVVNPKEDGLEQKIQALLGEFGIDEYFFLDLTYPTLIRLGLKERMRQIAVRVSEYESVENAMLLKGKANWVWVDCFSGSPPDSRKISLLNENFRTCLVSPELQGYPADQIERFKALSEIVTAVCTKYPERWQ